MQAAEAGFSRVSATRWMSIDEYDSSAGASSVRSSAKNFFVSLIIFGRDSTKFTLRLVRGDRCLRCCISVRAIASVTNFNKRISAIVEAMDCNDERTVYSVRAVVAAGMQI